MGIFCNLFLVYQNFSLLLPSSWVLHRVNSDQAACQAFEFGSTGGATPETVEPASVESRRKLRRSRSVRALSTLNVLLCLGRGCTVYTGDGSAIVPVGKVIQLWSRLAGLCTIEVGINLRRSEYS